MKYSNKLSLNKKKELINRFVTALTELRTAEDSAAFIEDILTKDEVHMLARRLAVAERLIVGARYADIIDELGVSAATISRVNTWLTTSGIGFRNIHHRIRSSATTSQPRHRRQATIYNWPIVLLDEVLQQSSVKQRERIERLLSKLDDKSALYAELNPLIAKHFNVSKKDLD